MIDYDCKYYYECKQKREANGCSRCKRQANKIVHLTHSHALLEKYGGYYNFKDEVREM